MARTKKNKRPGEISIKAMSKQQVKLQDGSVVTARVARITRYTNFLDFYEIGYIKRGGQTWQVTRHLDYMEVVNHSMIFPLDNGVVWEVPEDYKPWSEPRKNAEAMRMTPEQFAWLKEALLKFLSTKYELGGGGLQTKYRGWSGPYETLCAFTAGEIFDRFLREESIGYLEYKFGDVPEAPDEDNILALEDLGDASGRHARARWVRQVRKALNELKAEEKVFSLCEYRKGKECRGWAHAQYQD